jgi:hypothetical protein
MAATSVTSVSQSVGLQGGVNAWLNVTTAQIVKPAPGILCTVTVVVAGSAGALTLNDCATTGAAATANQIISSPYNATNYYAGAILILDWPCGTGIVVSAVPTGGQVSIAYS